MLGDTAGEDCKGKMQGESCKGKMPGEDCKGKVHLLPIEAMSPAALPPRSHGSHHARHLGFVTLLLPRGVQLLAPLAVFVSFSTHADQIRLHHAQNRSISTLVNWSWEIIASLWHQLLCMV